ncbi:hypothetical protein Taro_003528 [Colocasia esculenta]|uniref:FAR1 domain-containing protein n=1 Tax=Colocasia esculenta TaxID=4460 RepID=A0A843TMD1_COLES|nr:hypothetical protein [Colocasia esculenta]
MDLEGAMSGNAEGSPPFTCQRPSPDTPSYEPTSNETFSISVGMEFEDSEAAYNHYLSYAKRMGFSVRKEYLRKIKEGIIRSRRFVYSREGWRKRYRRDIHVKVQHVETRMGCETKMAISLYRNGKYRRWTREAANFVLSYSATPPSNVTDSKKIKAERYSKLLSNFVKLSTIAATDLKAYEIAENMCMKANQQINEFLKNPESKEQFPKNVQMVDTVGTNSNVVHMNGENPSSNTPPLEMNDPGSEVIIDLRLGVHVALVANSQLGKISREIPHGLAHLADFSLNRYHLPLKPGQTRLDPQLEVITSGSRRRQILFHGEPDALLLHDYHLELVLHLRLHLQFLLHCLHQDCQSPHTEGAEVFSSEPRTLLELRELVQPPRILHQRCGYASGLNDCRGSVEPSQSLQKDGSRKIGRDLNRNR